MAQIPEKIQRLIDAAGEINLAEGMNEQILQDIASAVYDDYEIDKRSRVDWEQQAEEASKLAKLLEEQKNFPFDKASNVKYPLITQAAIQFASRTYPSINQDGRIVRAKVIGQDPEGEKSGRADRISQYMSWQLSEQMPEWEADMDRLISYYCIAGIAFKKTYFSEEWQRPVSEFVRAENMHVHYWAKEGEERRFTHEYELWPNHLIESQNAGIFLKNIDLGFGDTEAKQEEGGGTRKNPVIILEQHRWWDIDGDGYEEPYIVTMAKSTQKILRIVARWEPENVVWNEENGLIKIIPDENITKYELMPSVDGSYYGFGLGMLLRPTNKLINSILNRLLDAGTLQNAGGGLISTKLKVKGQRTKSGAFRFKLGEYIVVDTPGGMPVGNYISPLQFPGPSPVLFQALGLIIESAERAGSAVDVLSGQESRANQPATTTLALIEQGLKFFTAITKRLHRSLKSEFVKIFKLNRQHLNTEQYGMVLDGALVMAREDFNDKDFDVVPVSDPKDVTDVQKLVKAEALMALKERPPQNKFDLAITKKYLEALRIENVAEFLPKPEELNQPDPKFVIEQAKIQMLGRKIALDEAKIDLEKEKLRAEITRIQSEALRNLQQSDSEQSNAVIQDLQSQLEAIIAERDVLKTQVMAKPNKETATKAPTEGQ